MFASHDDIYTFYCQHWLKEELNRCFERSVKEIVDASSVSKVSKPTAWISSMIIVTLGIAEVPRGVYAGGGGGEDMPLPFLLEPDPSAEELRRCSDWGWLRGRSSVEVKSWLSRGTFNSGGGGAKLIDSFLVIRSGDDAGEVIFFSPLQRNRDRLVLSLSLSLFPFALKEKGRVSPQWR